MAVATRTAGRNLTPYRTLRQGELRVLVTPDLADLASNLRVSTRRWVTQGFQVELDDDGSCTR